MRSRAAAVLDAHAGSLAAAATGIAALAALVWWASVDPTSRLVLRRPGLDGVGASAGLAEAVVIGETFESFGGAPAGGAAGSWPGFRGAAHDNVSSEAVSDDWDGKGPRRLWSVALGEGHAGAAVADGRVFLLDYDEERRRDALRCFSLEDGRELWRRSYRVRIKRNHGFSRTVPAVSGRTVVTIGPRGHVMAVDAQTGELRWTIDLERDFGTTIPLWYTGQCPLVDGDVVVLAPAGRALVVGVSAATGQVLWSVPNPHGWQMSHTSVVRTAVAGQDMYVYSALGGMVGIGASGDTRGRLLWETTLWTKSVLAPSPLPLPGGRLFVTAGYGAGSALLRIERSGAGFAVSELSRFAPAEGLASEQQTPVAFDGHVYGIQPKDAGGLRDQLVSFAVDELRKPVWSSGTERFGLGPYLIAGGRLLVLDDDGMLTLAETGSAGYRRIARAKVLDGVDAWAPMALASGRLLLRDSRRLVCLDLRAQGRQG